MGPEVIVPGLTHPKMLGLERFLIRLRDGSTTQSAWRLSVESGEGRGSIIYVELSPEETFFRGDGVFLGWQQDQMASAYKALLPTPEGPPLETQQLG